MNEMTSYTVSIFLVSVASAPESKPPWQGVYSLAWDERGITDDDWHEILDCNRLTLIPIAAVFWSTLSMVDPLVGVLQRIGDSAGASVEFPPPGPGVEVALCAGSVMVGSIEGGKLPRQILFTATPIE